MNDFEKFHEDSGFMLFKGYEKGPSKGEIEVKEKSKSPVRESSFLNDTVSLKS